MNIENKRVLVISDIHLGDGTGSDDFQYQTFRKIKDAEKRLLAWIESLDVDVLVLAGDIEELWQHRQKTIRRIYKEFFAFLARKKHVRIVGNHDITVLGREHIILEHGSFRYFIAHGHQGNKMMLNPFVRIGVRLVALLEKIVPSIDDMAQFALKTKESDLTADYARRMTGKYDFVILGHTHKAGAFGSYYNTGTCQHGRLEGVLIDDGHVNCITS
jgi:predicted phosphodiesterase